MDSISTLATMFQYAQEHREKAWSKVAKATEKFPRKYESSGILRYNPNGKVYLEVDTQLVKYYRSLIPKSWNVQGTRYGPHITVVRVDVEYVKLNWGICDGCKINFQYENIIDCSDNRCWLNCYSDEIVKIRELLGLGKFREGYRRFHMTIGRLDG